MHAVHPGLGGVLLSGGSGTAKSVLLRGAAWLADREKPIQVPLGVTEDRLLGSIDLRHVALTGQRRLQAGLLAQAHGRTLLVDNLNLLPPAFAYYMMEASKSGCLQLEREGLSVKLPARFRMFASIQPEEGELPAAILDQFGLFVEVRSEEGLRERKEIIRRQLEYEKDSVAFTEAYAAESASLRLRIAAARKKLRTVTASDACIRLAAQVAREAGCQGHRGEIYLLETARALAAWEERVACTEEDIRRASRWVLPHRLGASGEDRRQVNGQDDVPPDGMQEHGGESGEQAGDWPDKAAAASARHQPEQPVSAEGGSGSGESALTPHGSLSVQEIGRQFAARQLVFKPRDRLLRSGAGRRNLTRSGTRQGRYITFTLPRGKVTDLALDATLRAAAPFQALRRRGGGMVAIEPEDIRQKVRERRTGSALLFVVDASGSMAARRQMEAVKGAILSLLQDAYQKRDRIGMVAFRGEGAEEILPLTRSFELAAKELRELPTGGKTPLAKGMLQGWRVIDRARRKDKELIPVLILVTDGKANRGANSAGTIAAVLEECLTIGRAYRETGMHALVIDTEQGFIRLGQAARLAEAMGAVYYRLEELDGSRLAAAVRQLIN
jgi:magnesium chelatase subunit D